MYQIVGMEEAKSKLAELVGQAKYGGKKKIVIMDCVDACTNDYCLYTSCP